MPICKGASSRSKAGGSATKGLFEACAVLPPASVVCRLLKLASSRKSTSAFGAVIVLIIGGASRGVGGSGAVASDGDFGFALGRAPTGGLGGIGAGVRDPTGDGGKGIMAFMPPAAPAGKDALAFK